MTAATFKGVNMTLHTADPRVPLESGSQGGKLRMSTDTLAVTTTMTDEVSDVWFLGTVPSNAKIHSIKFSNDVAIDAHATPTGDMDWGIYNGNTKFTIGATSWAAEAVIDQNCYASAIAGTTAAGLGIINVELEVAWEARDHSACHNYVWQDAGLASDPNVDLTIAMTMVTAGVATHADADVLCQVYYTVE